MVKVVSHPVGAVGGVPASSPRLDDPRLDEIDALLADGVLDDPRWRDAAACLGIDTRVFYPSRGQSVRPARGVCRGCPVRMECLSVAVATGQKFGIWGDTTDRVRRRLRQGLVARHPEWGLDRQELAWEEEPYDHMVVGAGGEPASFERRPHQIEAVAAIVAALADGGPAQVAMACGSGKTLVALWAAEELDAQTVLIQVPSLALVGQTARMWRAATRWVDAEWLTVCSKDETASSVAATTDPVEASAFLARPGRRIVIATYQSSAVIAATGARFDLAVLDEAHHVAADSDGPSAAIIRGDILADRRLFMTATPRTWKPGRNGIERLGMDDRAVYGERVYTLSLRQAIERGIAADYRVILAGVDKETYGALTESPYLGTVHPATVTAAVATLRTMAEYGLSRCVSFHSRVTGAHQFSRLIGPLVAALDDAERPEGPGWAAWLHGGSTARTRRRLLDRLQHGGGWGIISNARVLGEGVDIPALDAISMVDPRYSEVDVGQAIGRALRTTEPGQVGTVILPVAIGDDGEITERSLEVAASVLRALRAHDPELGQQLDTARRQLGQARGPQINWRAALGERLVFRLPPNATRKLAQAVTLRLVREASSSWDEAFGALTTWVEDHGSARVPQAERVEVGDGRLLALGSWASQQRAVYRTGHLEDDRVAALEALPGWEWEPLTAQWDRQFNALAAWAAVHGSAVCAMSATHEDVRIGQFVNWVRNAYRDGKLSAEKVAALEALPGWAWNQRRTAWDAHFEELRGWAATHGHARPSHGDIVEGGTDIGRWVSKQRGNLRGGRLEQEQVAMLRSLPGWVDHEREAAWEAGFEHLIAWLRAGTAFPAHSAVSPDGYGLGRWIAKQRAAFAAGRMAPERSERLERIPGWRWTPRADADPFFDRVAMVTRFAEREGHGRVPDGYVVDGVRLGEWVVTVRGMHRKNKLTAERRAALEAIPGWAWSAHDASWEIHFAALEQFVAREGHAEMAASWREGSVGLGAWLRRQLTERAAGTLSPERQSRLDAVLRSARRAA